MQARSIPHGSENANEKPMRVAICSTFAPRQCGLATFAADLAVSLRDAEGVESVAIVAMQRLVDLPVDAALGDGRDPKRLVDIDDHDPASYRSAAQVVNGAADVVIVQHEFGIYGGANGQLLLGFLQGLHVPYVLTLHTVLPVFTPEQIDVLRRACAGAAAVTVFTETARALLLHQSIVAREKVAIVPHGAPTAIYEATAAVARARLSLNDRYVMSSFGLVSEGKGLELAIESLPIVAAKRDDAVLVIAGQTHPEIRRREGERYRDSLISLARRCGVEDRVVFMDGFLGIEEIADLLAATDVFVTPYRNLSQVVSGALTFALAAGCPIVSTPYLYASDQLTGGAGLLVEDRSAEAFAHAVLRFAADPAAAARARHASTAIGETMRWPAVGGRVAALCAELLETARKARASEALELWDTSRSLASESAHPARGAPLVAKPPPHGREVRFGHLRCLVDDTAIIQHATGMVPLLSSGYCVDDVARAIPVAQALVSHDPSWDAVMLRSVAFVAHAHLPGSALLSNFLSWNRQWVDEPYFGDHVGRALVGLSAVAGDARCAPVVLPLMKSILQAWPQRDELHPQAFALIAQAQAPSAAEPALMKSMLQKLLRAYVTSRTVGWKWFEPTIRYDHSRFPHALMAGGLAVHDDNAVEIGLETLSWYTRLCDRGDHYRFPGHLGLGRGDDPLASGDEQPLEAFAFLEAQLCAYEITNDRLHRDHALQAYDWYFGANRLGRPMAIETTGACHDGLSSDGVNRNCGAESTLSFLGAHLALRRATSAPVTRRRLAVLPAIPTFDHASGGGGGARPVRTSGSMRTL